MTKKSTKRLISIVVPIHNEKENIPILLKELQKIMNVKEYQYEIILVDDGSTDGSTTLLQKLDVENEYVRHIEFSRNFGKELAITAGLHMAKGDAAISMDADLQHPPVVIPEFLTKWEEGAEVVVGVRKQCKSEGFVRRAGSYLYYKIINFVSDAKVVPQSTDFRLLDRIVLDEFNRLKENNRITRGLIDWLGFKREYILFEAGEREYGTAQYSVPKLFQLALTSIVTSGLFPLRIGGYLGVGIIFLSVILGGVMLFDSLFDWGMNFSGTAILADLTLFLIGIVMISLGVLAFYTGHIHQEVLGRPMYVIRKKPQLSKIPRPHSPIFEKQRRGKQRVTNQQEKVV